MFSYFQDTVLRLNNLRYKGINKLKKTMKYLLMYNISD